MTKTIKLIGALAALSVGGSLFAQTETNPTPDLGAGLLGHRYAEAGFEYTDVNHTPVDAWSTGLLINNPIAPHIDVSLDYTYSWAKGYHGVHDNDINVNGIYYNDFGAFKPFVGASLGYEWTHLKVADFDGEEGVSYVNYDDNRTTFGARVGVEYQVNARFVVTGQAEFNSDFKRNDDDNSWNGTLTGHYWITKQIAAYATLAWLEYGDFGYGAGVTYKF